MSGPAIMAALLLASAPDAITLPVLPLDAPAPAAPSAPAAKPDEAATDTDDITVQARKADARDPMESVNVKSFKTVTAVDEAVTGPIAVAYKKALPNPVRSGLRNVLANLHEPVVFVNFLLQLKPGKAMETAGRFTLNSTIGAAGLFDVAKRKPFHLPQRRNGFGYTMGYYGVKPGPFLYLPLIGPTTLRDVVGRGMDLFALPVAVGEPFNSWAYTLTAGTIRSLDDRAETDEAIRKLREESPDPYATTRDRYLTTRQAEIDALRGKPVAPPVLVPQPTSH